MLRVRVSKLEQWESCLVARTDSPSIPDHTSDILGLTMYTAIRLTNYDLLYGHNLL